MGGQEGNLLPFMPEIRQENLTHSKPLAWDSVSLLGCLPVGCETASHRAKFDFVHFPPVGLDLEWRVSVEVVRPSCVQEGQSWTKVYRGTTSVRMRADFGDITVEPGDCKNAVTRHKVRARRMTKPTPTLKMDKVELRPFDPLTLRRAWSAP